MNENSCLLWVVQQMTSVCGVVVLPVRLSNYLERV